MTNIFKSTQVTYKSYACTLLVPRNVATKLFLGEKETLITL